MGALVAWRKADFGLGDGTGGWYFGILKLDIQSTYYDTNCLHKEFELHPLKNE